MRVVSLLLAFLLSLFSYACCQSTRADFPETRYDGCLTESCIYLDSAIAFKSKYPHLDLPPLDQSLESVNATSYLYPSPAISYNPKWMAQMRRRWGTDMVYGVFAHELGHAVCFQERGDTSESCADYEGGCLMAVMQRDTAPFKRWVQGHFASTRYPNGEVRANTFQTGFDRCSTTQ